MSFFKRRSRPHPIVRWRGPVYPFYSGPMAKILQERHVWNYYTEPFLIAHGDWCQKSRENTWRRTYD